MDLCPYRFPCGIRRFAFVAYLHMLRGDLQLAEEIIIHFGSADIGVAVVACIAVSLLHLLQMLLGLFLALYMKNIPDEPRSFDLGDLELVVVFDSFVEKLVHG